MKKSKNNVKKKYKKEELIEEEEKEIIKEKVSLRSHNKKVDFILFSINFADEDPLFISTDKTEKIKNLRKLVIKAFDTNAINNNNFFFIVKNSSINNEEISLEECGIKNNSKLYIGFNIYFSIKYNNQIFKINNLWSNIEMLKLKKKVASEFNLNPNDIKLFNNNLSLDNYNTFDVYMKVRNN